ncbi:ABC transporter permease [Vibrio sonorensis]|uniref:ABC transporter permease n=1 Tax=Vibrio sonorensis TaxID=1004316 RepID=UPI0008D9DB49|nr:ABC transporter permease [Vibrio sonorensis]
MEQSKNLNFRLLDWSVSEIRHGQLWPVSIALTLIIACIFALTALAARMEQVVVKQGKDALTADTLFTSSNPIPDVLLKGVEKRDLDVSTQTRFATMAFSDASMKLVTVKAVDSQFPLRGELRLSDGKRLQTSVKRNELWLDERLFSDLNVAVGDAVTIGDADFVISGKVLEEPGLSFNPFQQMPSVYIHLDSIKETGAIQEGSRVRYNLYINAEQSQVEALKELYELTPSDRWRDENSASRTNDVFQRTQQYLSLSVAIVVIMAATTLVLTCQHYVSTRAKTIAMLKSLGASRAWLGRWLTTQVTILISAAVVVGLIVGFGLENLLRIPLKDMLPDPLPSYGAQPFLYSIFTTLLIAIPALGIPLLNLLSVSAVNVLQPDASNSKKRYLWLLLFPVVALVVLYWDNVLVWMVLGGIVLLFVVLAGLSVSISAAIARLPLSTAFKLAISRINRTPLATGLQFGALALSLMLLAIMWLVRTDLLADWQRTLPENAPNAFALNIAPYEKEAYLNVIDENNIERSEAYPIVRGRLTQINGEEAKSRATGEEASDALRRELNFTWGEGIPDYNEVLSGAWTTDDGVSVESDIASELGLTLGDTLEFVINSQTVSAKVNSIRKVEWRDMKPNFYFIFTPDVLKGLPSTYLVSFRVSDQHDDVLRSLSRQHPTVSLMDIRAMGEKIQELLSQIVWAITLLAALGVVAGLLLIFTLLRLSLSQRMQEIQLYRTLGASRKRVTNTIWAEYGLMAVIAGLVATLGSELVVAALMMYGFELDPRWHVSLWVGLPLLTLCTLFLVVNSLIKRLLVPINKAFG